MSIALLVCVCVRTRVGLFIHTLYFRYIHIVHVYRVADGIRVNGIDDDVAGN